MIRKLQWRIISINMILMGIVIAAVCTALCVNAYTHAVEELEHGLNQVVERDGKGKFIPESTETGDSPFPFDKSQKERFEGKPDIHENAPMEISSYVTVELDANGNILNTTEHNVTIDEEDLQAIAQIVSKNGTRSGQLSDYGLMYVMKRTMSCSLLGLASTSSLHAAQFRFDGSRHVPRQHGGGVPDQSGTVQTGGQACQTRLGATETVHRGRFARTENAADGHSGKQ